MKSRNFAIAALLVLVVFCIGSLFFNIPRPYTGPLPSRADFQFTDTRSVTRSFYSVANKNVIVHFWATWCAPCLKELPELIDVVMDNPDVTLVAISVDRDVHAMQKFLEPYKQSRRIMYVWDNDRVIAKQFGVDKFPESFIFDHDVVQKAHISGVADWKNFKFSK